MSSIEEARAEKKAKKELNDQRSREGQAAAQKYRDDVEAENARRADERLAAQAEAERAYDERLRRNTLIENRRREIDEICRMQAEFLQYGIDLTIASAPDLLRKLREDLDRVEVLLGIREAVS